MHMMESIGVLPEPNYILSYEILSLFGIHSTVREWNEGEEDNIEKEICHFCLEIVMDNKLFTKYTQHV